MEDSRWPALQNAQWSETLTTLHLWTQIVGKIRLRTTPLINHWWNVALYVTPRGLTTSPMPYGQNGRTFAIDFDFLGGELRINDCDGTARAFALEPMSVADFYRRLMDELAAMGITVKINMKPSEMPGGIRFDEDQTHASYDREAVIRFFRVLLQADRLCKEFRAGFLGKCSPVHFFWGSFDLAYTRFSGRKAPPHPGGIPNMPDSATREAYSHEEFSAGFWPGGSGFEAAFYSYAYPEPQGLAQAAVSPAGAQYNGTLKEFILPYDAVRTSDDPDRGVLGFFSTAYNAAADLARWDREALERAEPSSA